jgi:thioredoxin 1
LTTGRHIVYSLAPQVSLWQGLCGHAPNRIFMDDELERIREKKRREMAERLQGTGEKGTKNPVVHPVNQANFRQMLTAHPFLVIDFWAEWCGPCRMVGPVIEELSREYAGMVTFAKCNTDENPGLASRPFPRSFCSAMVVWQTSWWAPTQRRP